MLIPKALWFRALHLTTAQAAWTEKRVGPNSVCFCLPCSPVAQMNIEFGLVPLDPLELFLVFHHLSECWCDNSTGKKQIVHLDELCKMQKVFLLFLIWKWFYFCLFKKINEDCSILASPYLYPICSVLNWVGRDLWQNIGCKVMVELLTNRTQVIKNPWKVHENSSRVKGSG